MVRRRASRVSQTQLKEASMSDLALVDEARASVALDGETQSTPLPAPPPPSGPFYNQLVHCPVEGCQAVQRRENMKRHLMTQRPGHGFNETHARIESRRLPVSDEKHPIKPDGGKSQPRGKYAPKK